VLIALAVWRVSIAELLRARAEGWLLLYERYWWM